MPRRLSEHEKSSAKVDRNDFIEALDIAPRNRRKRHDAGAVYNHLNWTKYLRRLGEELSDLIWLGDVARDRKRMSAGGFDLAYRLFSVLDATRIVHHNRKAVRCQSPGDTSTDATRASRYDCCISHDVLLYPYFGRRELFPCSVPLSSASIPLSAHPLAYFF